jgi:hypothetical protein
MPSDSEMCGCGIDHAVRVGGGKREVLGICGEVRADGVGVDVVAMHFEIAPVFDAALCEAVFPDGHFGFEAEGESAFNELHGLLDGDDWRGREKDVDVIGHEDEGVDLIAASGTIFVQELYQEFCVGASLEKAAAIGGNGGDEEGADLLRGEGGHALDVRGSSESMKDYDGAEKARG